MKCLRSGECCTAFEVHGVLGYLEGKKPAFEACKHLVKAYQDNCGQWHRAHCKLHGTSDYPDECEKFNFPGDNGMCGLGQAIWKARGIDNPDVEAAD